MKLHFAYILLLLLLNQCKPSIKNMSPLTFIDSIKTNDMSLLSNIIIEARNERDRKYHYPFVQYISNTDTFNLPAFEYFDKLNDTPSLYNIEDVYKFAQIKGVQKDGSIEFVKNYVREIDSIYHEFKIININYFPQLGDFIEFTISSKCKVYFLKNIKSLDSKWKDYFNTLVKVDNEWFYICK